MIGMLLFGQEFGCLDNQENIYHKSIMDMQKVPVLPKFLVSIIQIFNPYFGSSKEIIKLIKEILADNGAK